MLNRRLRFVTASGLISVSAAIGSSQVARVYVSYTPSGSSTNKVAEFYAASNGSLTSIPGSPYAANVGSMALTGTYLFGSNLNGKTVASFRIQSNGSLKWVNSTDVQTPDPTGCASPTEITLDHSGASLYREQFSGGLCDHSHYQSFSIDKTTGKLQYIGKSADTFLFNTPLTFTADDLHAYGSECLDFQGGPLDTFAGYVRHSTGVLNQASISAPDPSTRDSNDFYCRAWTAADPTKYLAVTFTDTNFNDPSSSPPAQLGVYTVQSNGSLTTTSTWSNMPSTAVGGAGGLAMSPDGELIAVYGSAGVQIFRFNGSNPMTHFTNALTTSPINQVGWDRSHHLYAVSRSAGKLYVFTVTSTGAANATGSPHLLNHPAHLVVRSLN